MKKSKIILFSVVAVVILLVVCCVVFISCDNNDTKPTKPIEPTEPTNSKPIASDPTHQHVAGDWIVDREATYEAEGKKHKECVECGAVLEEASIPVLKSASEGLEFALNEDGESYYVKGMGTCTDTEIIIPSEYNGKPVTAIGDMAFLPAGWENENIEMVLASPCIKITNIVIPDSVTSIGEVPFGYCISLVSITIGESVTTISDTWFYGLTSLVEICNRSSLYIPYEIDDYESFSPIQIITDDSQSNLKHIGDYIFYDDGAKVYLVKYTGNDTEMTLPQYQGGKRYDIYKYSFSGSDTLTNIAIPNCVVNIGKGAFSGCYSLESVTIADSVITIGEYAFSSCSSLENISIPDSVMDVSDDAFDGCDSLKYNEYDNAYYLGNESNPYVVLMEAKSKDIISCEIHGDTKFIAAYSFYDCESLVSVVLGDSVRAIGNSAFSGCVSLKSISIPDSIMSIGDYAFYKCEFSYNEYDNAYYLGNESNPYVVLIKAKNEEITSCDIYDKTKIIFPYAFKGCSKLESIVIPDSVVDLGKAAFNGCYSLTNVVLGDGITSLKSRDGEHYWGDYLGTFEGCQIENITIPASLKFIDIDTFGYSEPKNVYYKGDIEDWLSIEFNSWIAGEGTKVYFNNELVTEVDIPDSITSIPDGAFGYWSWLTKVNIPNSVVSIGDGAFCECTSLASIVIPNSVKSIGDDAFINCESLVSVVIGNSVKNIGEYAFGGCTLLESVSIPNSVTSIGTWAFGRCTSLKSINIPNSVTSIGDYAFSNCESLVSVVIGDSVREIGDYAFSYCYKIASINIPDSVMIIGDYAFYYCYSMITSINIPDSVTSIGYQAFGKTNFSNIDVDKNNQYYKSIDGNLYSKDGTVLIKYAVGKLDKSFDIPDSVTTIYDYAFASALPLASVNIPDSVTSIGKEAFDSCLSLISITIPDSVTSIGERAFSNCNSLVKITLGKSVTEIGDYALQSCGSLIELCNKSELNIDLKQIGDYIYGYDDLLSLTYIIEDESQSKLRYVGDYIFYDGIEGIYLVKYAGDETELILPQYDRDKTYNIYYMAFNNMAFHRLTVESSSVYISRYVSKIMDGALLYCEHLQNIEVDENNPNYKSIDGNLYSKDGKTLIQYAFGKEEETFIIPDFVENIGNNAFYSALLKNITIPSSVINISANAFYVYYDLVPGETREINIYYEGTIEQFKAICESNDNGFGILMYWYDSYTVYCTDGQIVKGKVTYN